MIKLKNIEYSLLLVYILLVLLGIKEFTIWGQITEWLTPNDMEANIPVIASLIAVEHPHVLRVLLLVPFYAISEYLSIDINIFFSLILIILVFTTYWLIVAILKDTIKRKKLFILLIFFIALSFVMNGRIVFSIFGNTLLLYLLYRSFYDTVKLKRYKFIVLFILSLWFVSVSSGTFTVFLLTIFIFYLLHSLVKLPYVSKKVIWLFLFFIILLLVLSPMITIFVDKNLDYYDGSVINMLSHGAGKYLVDYFYIVFPLFAILVLLQPIAILYLKRYKFLILPLSMILSSLAVGLFGFSSLVSGISAYLIFIYMFMCRVPCDHGHIPERSYVSGSV